MDGLDRYKPLETALKESGFVVDGIEKQEGRTVITVFQSGKGGENPAFAVTEASSKATKGGEPGINGPVKAVRGTAL